MGQHTLGSTTRPYSSLEFAEACERIAGAGYLDVAMFAHNGNMPIDSSSSDSQVAAARKAARRPVARPEQIPWDRSGPTDR